MEKCSSCGSYSREKFYETLNGNQPGSTRPPNWHKYEIIRCSKCKRQFSRKKIG